MPNSMNDIFSNIRQIFRSGLNAIATEDAPQPSAPSRESVREGFEIKDANALGLLIAAIGVVITGIVIQLLLGLSFSSFKHRQMNVDVSQPNPPADFKQSSAPEKELSDYRSRVKHELNSYGWMDREKKIVHIPIQEAMERLAHEN